MNSKSMLIAAGIGGVIMLVLTKIPLISCLNCLFCVSYWGSGILTVWFYRQMEKANPGLDVGQGIILGLLAGVAGAILASFVGAIFSGAGALSALDFDPQRSRPFGQGSRTFRKHAARRGVLRRGFVRRVDLQLGSVPPLRRHRRSHCSRIDLEEEITSFPPLFIGPQPDSR